MKCEHIGINSAILCQKHAMTFSHGFPNHVDTQISKSEEIFGLDFLTGKELKFENDGKINDEIIPYKLIGETKFFIANCSLTFEVWTAAAYDQEANDSGEGAGGLFINYFIASGDEPQYYPEGHEKFYLTSEGKNFVA